MKPNESIPIRTLRNDVSRIVQRAEHGESFDVTRHGRAVARVVPIDVSRRMKTMAEFVNAARDAAPDEEFLQLVRELRDAEQLDPFERWEHE